MSEGMSFASLHSQPALRAGNGTAVCKFLEWIHSAPECAHRGTSRVDWQHTVRCICLPLSLVLLPLCRGECAPAAALICQPVPIIHAAIWVAAAPRPVRTSGT